MRLFKISIPTLLLLSSLPAFSQTADSSDSAVASPEKTHFIIGSGGNSAMNYYGRVDSLHSSALLPFVGIEFAGGLYINGTAVFLHNSLQKTQYAATIVEGGYNFRNAKNTWAGNLAATKYFYQGNTDLVQAVVKTGLAASLTNLNRIVNITLGATARFSDKTDLGAQAGLDHIIKITNVGSPSGILVFDPSVNAYAGTQNFTETWYHQRTVLIFPAGEEQETKNSQAFNILAYECSLPIVYGYKKLNLIVTPSYILPQHLLTIPGQPSLSEKGGNLFYCTATIKLTL